MAAASAFVLTGCTETDLSGDTSLAKESTPSAIQFSAKTRNAGVTRTGTKNAIANTDALKSSNDGFAVFAFNTAANTWQSNGSSTAPNFMYNEQVKYNNTTNKWEYDPIKYWPNGIDAANAANSPSNTAKQGSIQNLSFFAYAPYVDVTASSGAVATGTATETNGYETWGITGLTKNTDNGDPKVTYKFYYVGDAYSLLTKDNVDLLWGTRKSTSDYSETDGTDNNADAESAYKDGANNYYNTDLTKQVVDETVDFNFKHALAKFGGFTGSLKAVLDIDGNGDGEMGYGDWTNKDNTNVTIQSITIKNAAADAGAFTIGGTFDIATGTWDTFTKNAATIAEGAAYTLTINNETTGVNGDIMVEAGNATYETSTWTKSGVPTKTAGNIFSSNNEEVAFYLIPGVANQKLIVSVTYQVSTYDENISGNYVRTNQTITNEVTLPELKPNKYYTLVMHLGLTSVKFSAEVADWERVEGGDTEGAEEIWLPSNVVSSGDAVTLAAGSGATVNTAAGTTTYTINLTGLKTSTDVTSVAYSGVATGASQSGSTDTGGNGTITVTLPVNGEATTKTSTITIKGIDNSDNEFTTTVTIIQAAGV